jgi:hypothetical protein
VIPDHLNPLKEIVPVAVAVDEANGLASQHSKGRLTEDRCSSFGGSSVLFDRYPEFVEGAQAIKITSRSVSILV